MNLSRLRIVLLGVLALAFAPTVPATQPPPKGNDKLFARDNLIAWCIVPFDAEKRTPAQRVEMLGKLGFKKYAYDWRAEHLPTFDEEVGLLKKAGIELTAVWFPANLGPDAKKLLEVIRKHGVKTQLWVTMGDPGGKTPGEKVGACAKALRPIAEEADKLGCTIALYNHGGWFGEPENQLAVIEALKLKNVGIVYNQHHGHDHLDRFPALLKKMQPHLLALNLNGMVTNGEKLGKKILPLGEGELDLKLLKVITESGYTGPIGILGHTNDDAQERLSDNLDGLHWLLPQLTGKPAGAKPKYRTMAAAPVAVSTAGWLAEGMPEYRAAPITVECRAKLNAKAGFNILVASDTKASAMHWEMFTWPGTGQLTVYMPGMKPDHVRSDTDVCDGKWHTLAMQYEATRVRLFVDGKKVAEQEMKRERNNAVDGGIAFARLVEGGIGCDGELDRVRISKGIVEPSAKELTATDATLGLWTFAGRDKPAEDASKTKNSAKPVAVAKPAPLAIPPGTHLTTTDPKLKVTLIDRSDDDAYMAVKIDAAGKLFVAGREKVFVFPPDGKGSFGPRRELLAFPQDSIIIGLEFRGDDLYVLASHALYLVPGGRVKTDRLAPKRILWGVPLDFHVSFHCMAWGPEGDLYLDHGDPLLNYGDWSRPDHWGHWTLFAGPKGERVPYTGAGAVLKVKPDGSNPRVVARGLRGPVGLAFDKNWNLFTNDNDHESRADQYAPCKLLHVTPQADFAWPRGWMASKSPDRADLVESVHPALGRGVPCDQAFHPAGDLLVCRWDRFAVTRYPLKAKGASFTAEELVFAQGSNQCRPTGITVDTAGRIFVTSHYLGGNVVTPHCPSDVVMIAPSDKPLSLFDESKATIDDLWAALENPTWEVRRRAHHELLRRGGAALAPALERLAKVRGDSPAAAHLPWLTAASNAPGTWDALSRLARASKSDVLRLQSLRALPPAAAQQAIAADAIFREALDDRSPAIQLAALERVGHSEVGFPTLAVGRLAASPDPVLRQLAVTHLARFAHTDSVAVLLRSEDSRTRLAGVLVVGMKLTVPRPDAKPPEGVKLSFPAKNAFFSPELRFADAAEPVDITKLGPIGSYTTAQWWAAKKRTEDDERLFRLLVAALDDRDELVASQSAYFLGWLRDPRSELAVAKVRLDLRTRGVRDREPVTVKEVWASGRITDEAEKKTIERGPIDLATGKWNVVKVAVPAASLPLPNGKGTAYHYFRIQSRDRQTAMVSGVAASLWHNGRSVTPESDGSLLLDLQPGSNDILVGVSGALPVALAVRAKGAVSLSLPDKTDGAALAERLKAAKGAPIPPDFLKIDWVAEGRKGNAENGRKLFGTLGCVKCHAVTADQTGGGAPSLTQAGKRFTPAHLAESVLLPDRLVAEEFRATKVTTTDEQSVLGLVVRESPIEIEVLLPDTTRRVLKVTEIASRKPVAASPMPAGLVKTPDELRDLITYLLSDNPLPP